MPTKPPAPPSTKNAAALRQRYLTGLNPKARRAVRQLLAEIRTAAPTAIPVFSYRIPGYRLNDRPLLWCAGFAQHVSLYPITAGIQKAHAATLIGYKTSTGTVQFSLAKPIPVALARRLIKARIVEVHAESRSRKTSKRAAS